MLMEKNAISNRVKRVPNRARRNTDIALHSRQYRRTVRDEIAQRALPSTPGATSLYASRRLKDTSGLPMPCIRQPVPPRPLPLRPPYLLKITTGHHPVRYCSRRPILTPRILYRYPERSRSTL